MRGIMKKLISVMFILVMLTGINKNVVYAAKADEGIEVSITISDGTGKTALAQEPVKVIDKDGDGIISVNDALFTVHEAKYTGGAAAGYTSVDSEFGKSLVKLWGVENGGSYGYYINNVSAMSLLDTVKDGDSIYAYAYSDLTGWSDAYSYFDMQEKTVKQKESTALTLNYAGFDAEWNPVTLPVDGAVIIIDGKATEYVTDSEGKVSIIIDEAGEHLISAKSDKQILVPPVCTITVEGTFPILWTVVIAIVAGILVGMIIIILKSKKNA